MKRRYRLTWQHLLVPLVSAVALGGLALVAWLSQGLLNPAFVVGYVGVSIAAAIVIYLRLPRHDRVYGRRLAVILIGAAVFGMAALRDTVHFDFQIEGLFFDLLAGVFQAAVLHYLIGKIVGPLLFGRVWCGWACWTAAVLDQLPFKRSPGRLPGRWGWLRSVHFAFSLGLVLLLWFGLGYRIGETGAPAIAWFLAGNVLYYSVGIGLAFLLKDNRAFCKYVCPVSIPLKLASNFALLRVKGNPDICNKHEECVAVCPMDIRITDYILHGERVRSTECTLCQSCIAVCQEQALSLSFGFEPGGKELLRLREKTGARSQESGVRS